MPSIPREDLEWYEYQTGYEIEEFNKTKGVRGELATPNGGWMAEEGVRGYLLGLPNLGRKRLKLALPQLLLELGPDGPPEFPTTVVDEKRKMAVEGGKEVTTAITQTIRLGWSAMEKSDDWLCIALCRWLLNAEFDRESLKHASDEVHRHYDRGKDPLLNDAEELDFACPRFSWAGHFDRCLRYLEGRKRFKIPRMPSSVITERAMAYVLAVSHRPGGWPPDQVESASGLFVRRHVPKLLEHGQIISAAMWAMILVWREGKAGLVPHAALMKVAGDLGSGNVSSKRSSQTS